MEYLCLSSIRNALFSILYNDEEQVIRYDDISKERLSDKYVEMSKMWWGV